MKDRVDIGLTPQARECLRLIEEYGWFADGQDIARFCLAYAVRKGVNAGDTTGVETQWSSGNFDPAGEIRSVLAALYPESKTPVRLIQHLVNQGLVMMGKSFTESHVSIDDLFDRALRE